MLVTPPSWPFSTVPCRIPAALVTCSMRISCAQSMVKVDSSSCRCSSRPESAITFSRSPWSRGAACCTVQASIEVNCPTGPASAAASSSSSGPSVPSSRTCLTVTVNDGGTSNNIVTRTFTVTINAVNQTPTILEHSNTYAAVVCTNLFRFRTNTLSSGKKIVMPLPPTYTNFVFTGFWIYYSPLGVWTLQSSSNLLTWFNYATVTNAVFIP